MADFDITIEDDDEGLSLDDNALVLDTDSEELVLDEISEEVRQANERRENGDITDVEKESLEEMSALLRGFKERSNTEGNRLVDALDSEYWIAVCFQSREMKEEFLSKTGLAKHGDKYLDGMKVARSLGVKLESPVPPMLRQRPFDKEYISISLDSDSDPLDL